MSPLETVFRLHYRAHDIRSGPWNRERLGRLAALLGLTFPELARFLRLTPNQLNRFQNQNSFPPSAVLLLDLVERSALSTKLGQEFSESLFPI